MKNLDLLTPEWITALEGKQGVAFCVACHNRRDIIIEALKAALRLKKELDQTTNEHQTHD